MLLLYVCTCKTGLSDRFSSLNFTSNYEILVFLCTSDQKIILFYVNVHSCIYNNRACCPGFFFSSDCLQSGRYKSYNQCQSFFLTLIFLLLLSSLEYFSLLHGLEATFRRSETVKAHVGDLVPINNRVVINPVICKTSRK